MKSNVYPMNDCDVYLAQIIIVMIYDENILLFLNLCYICNYVS